MSAGEGRIHHGLAARGALRWVAVDITPVVEEARRRHDLSPLASAALGRAMAGALLLSRLAPRRPERLILEIRGDGPLGAVVAEVDDRANLRGRVGEPRLDLPRREDGKLAVGEAVGKGILRVLRDRDGQRHSSQVALVSGEIGLDLAHYLEQSEQARSAVVVGVLARSGGVTAATGLIVEALADAAGEVLDPLQDNLSRLRGPSRLVEVGGLEALEEAVFSGLDRELLDSEGTRFRCGCDRASLATRLAGMDRETLREIEDEAGVIEAECAFCAARYYFKAEDLAHRPN